MSAEVDKRISQVVTGSAWAVVELLLTLFVLFYLFRDRRKALATLRSLVPLSERETDEVFSRVSDTIHATIYGTLVVAAVQGALGGLMFWWLDLPAPIFWGAVMALLAIVPLLGTLCNLGTGCGVSRRERTMRQSGDPRRADRQSALPDLVGKRMRLHMVPVFFAIVGGLAIFGAAGLVLGPVILALTDAILEIWHRRTAHGRPSEAGSTSGDATQPKKPRGRSGERTR